MKQFHDSLNLWELCIAILKIRFLKFSDLNNFTKCDNINYATRGLKKTFQVPRTDDTD